MIYPTLRGGGRTVSAINTFLGYDHNDEISNGEFYDTKNMTCDHYPIAAVRDKRKTLRTIYEKPQGIIAKNRVYYVRGGSLYYGDVTEKDTQQGLSETPVLALPGSHNAKRQLVSMGAYIIIFPDKIYYNTANGEHGSLETTVTINCGVNKTVYITMCEADGTDIGTPQSGATAPQNPSDGTRWIDTSGNTHVLKVYSASTSMWVTQSTAFVKISSPELINSGFKQSDGIKISGLSVPPETTKPTPAQISALCGAHVITALGNSQGQDAMGYIVIPGIIDDSYTFRSGTIEIKREVPDMDFVTECGNRIWGCKYGIIENGTKTVNEIYGSALGDPFNFTKFEGAATDSYAVSLGSDGVFTGAAAYLGYVMFFKENCIHKVYGSYPANFQVITTACRGVQKGCENSLVICDEVLFYKSPSDVCRYTGSLPEKISSPLGSIKYHGAAAGSVNGKYYISMADESNEYSLFTYDIGKGLWMKEDNTKAVYFARLEGELYYIEDCGDGTYKIKTTAGGSDENIDYFIRSGKIGFISKNRKYVNRVDLRLAVTQGTAFVYIKYDSVGDFVNVGNLSADTLKTVSFSIRPKRCDHFEIKIAGTGSMKLFSIYLTYGEGSSLK